MAFTGKIEMVHPNGNRVRIPHGPTQAEKDSAIGRYRRKGFKLPEDAARDAELETLRKQASRRTASGS